MERRIITDTYFSPIVKDYLAGNPSIAPFYRYPFRLEAFAEAARNRRFSPEARTLLTDVLNKQYAPLGKTHAAVKENIAALQQPDTFTVTTGHQICLMTGPLYFIFKIASAVKLARQLQEAYPQYRFVPVYWAAAEDHDFEEIRSVFLDGKNYTWEPPQPVSGATGRISTQGLADFFAGLENAEGEKLSYNSLYQTFKKAWTEQPNLSAAVRKAVHDVFGHLGVVSLDADDARLKHTCTGWLGRELKESFSYHAVKETSQALHDAGYKSQIEPREINLFYLNDGLRERFLREDDVWSVNNTGIRFTEAGLDTELQQHPERFSPNVVLRPLYQESILPNLAYIGGPAEIAYWLQLKGVFDAADTDFPVLVPRDGFLFAPEKELERFFALGFTPDDMLRKAETNLRTYVERTQGEKLSVQHEKQVLYELFTGLKQRYAQADNHAVQSFSAVETKLKKELSKLEKKAKKFAGRKEETTATFLHSVHEQWFPGGTLAERKNSILEFWGLPGAAPADALVNMADPLTPGLKVIPF